MQNIGSVEVSDKIFIYLLKNGYFSKLRRFGTKNAEVLHLEPGKCHLNAATVSLEKGYKHILGFVKGGNKWVTHSWCWNGKNIIETGNVLGEIYLGIELPSIVKLKKNTTVLKL